MDKELKKHVENHDWLPLWEREQPGEVDHDRQEALIAAYLVPDSKWCVVIYPGGGYFQLSLFDEGTHVAEEYNQYGISAVVVRYRYQPYGGKAIMADGQKGLYLARTWLDDMGMSSCKIAVCGFSAGGHLSCMINQHAESYTSDVETPVVPDACILCYPVTTFCEGTFPLMPPIFLGKENQWATPYDFSYMAHIDRMAPTFFWYSVLDDCVDYKANTVAFADALQAHHIYCETHAYKDGGHGKGLAKEYKDSSKWFEASVHFLNHLS